MLPCNMNEWMVGCHGIYVAFLVSGKRR